MHDDDYATPYRKLRKARKVPKVLGKCIPGDIVRVDLSISEYPIRIMSFIAGGVFVRERIDGTEGEPFNLPKTTEVREFLHG